MQDSKICCSLKNIELIMKVTNTNSANAMAKRIGVAPTTWHSYLKNPKSNSVAKTAFCNYYGLTVHQLENSLLDESFISQITSIDISSNENIEMPLSEITEKELYNKLSTSSNPETFIDEELRELKKELIKYKSLAYKAAISDANNMLMNDPINAYNIIVKAFLNMQPQDIYLLTQSELKLYIDLSNKYGDINDIENLIDRLALYDNYKILTVLSILLEEAGLIQCAKKCLKLVLGR